MDRDVIDEHRRLLRRLLPTDTALEVREGQFHHVVIGAHRVVCIARTPAAAQRLPRRAAVLRALAGVGLGVRTPRPLSRGDGTDGDGPAYLVLDRIPGAPVDADALSPAVAESVAEQFAALISTLGSAENVAAVRAVLPDESEPWQDFGIDVRADLFPLMSADGRRRAERELTAVEALPTVTVAVVHGDLGGENVLWQTVDGMPQLSGIIDWDEAGIGDPAVDLAAIGASYGEDLLARVLMLGGWTDAALAQRISATRDTFALQQARHGLRDGDDRELAEGLRGYRT